MKGLRIPTYLGNVSPEEMARLDIREAQDKAYTLTKEADIKKRLDKPNSSINKVQNYINSHYRDEIELEKMSKEIGVEVFAIKTAINDLNFYSEFGYRMKRVKGMKGWIQSIKKNLPDTEDYLTKKARTIATMEQVYGNIDEDINVKVKKKSKARQKIEVEANGS